MPITTTRGNVKVPTYSKKKGLKNPKNERLSLSFELETLRLKSGIGAGSFLFWDVSRGLAIAHHFSNNKSTCESIDRSLVDCTTLGSIGLRASSTRSLGNLELRLRQALANAHCRGCDERLAGDIHCHAAAASSRASPSCIGRAV